MNKLRNAEQLESAIVYQRERLAQTVATALETDATMARLRQWFTERRAALDSMLQKNMQKSAASTKAEARVQEVYKKALTDVVRSTYLHAKAIAQVRIEALRRDLAVKEKAMHRMRDEGERQLRKQYGVLVKSSRRRR